MNVVLYLRYSSDKQTEQSIEGQDRVCTEFCERNGYNIVWRYIDRATSAFKDTDKRTEFQRMIRESEKQGFQGVVVYKLDRFARNRYDSATYKAKLKRNGVHVISATENISDNPEGIILESVLEGMAEFYSKELSQKVNRGMYETALKANSCGGPIPLGYRVENKKYVVVDKDAAVVQEAFNLYADGKTITEIIDLFRKKGYRTAKGKEFNKCSFDKMLRNERYIGIYKYKDVRIEGGVPAIVDKKTFDIVQSRLKENASAPGKGKAKVDYLLAHKLYCGHCGAIMTGESGRSETGVKYYYYTCSCRKKTHKCDKKNMRKEWIERVVVEDVLALLTPERIEAFADMAIKANQEDIQNESLVPALKAELKDIETRTNNLIKLAERVTDSGSLADRLIALENERKDAEKRLAIAESDIVILEKEQVVYWLEKFSKGDIDDPDFCRSVLDLFVNSVTVWDEPGGYKITTIYNLQKHNRKTHKVKSSDFVPSGSPLFYYPNFSVFFIAEVFGMIKHREA